MRKDDSQILKDPKASWDTDWGKVWPEYYWRLRHHYRVVEGYLHGRILDIGCGPGFLAAKAFPNESYYAGVDISPVAITVAKMLFPAARFEIADVTKGPLPFRQGDFDTVVISEILEHVEDPAAVLREALRITSSYVVGTVPISMGGVGHIWPEWRYDEVVGLFQPAGNILEIRENREGNFWLVWLRRR